MLRNYVRVMRHPAGKEREPPDLVYEAEAGTVAEVSPLHPEKVSSPMVSTPAGIVTEVSPLQPLKALLPMVLTLAGMVTEVSPLQP